MCFSCLCFDLGSSSIVPSLMANGFTEWGTVVGMEKQLTELDARKSEWDATSASAVPLVLTIERIPDDDHVAESTVRLYYHLVATAFMEAEREETGAAFDRELAAVSQRAFWDDPLARKEWIRWIGYVDGNAVATVAVWARWAHLGAANLMDVTVVKPFRRKGIASQMVRHALAYAHGANFTRCVLQAEPDATPLYLSLGFTATSEIAVWEKEL